MQVSNDTSASNNLGAINLTTKHKSPDKSLHVVVNGRPKEVHVKVLSFAELVRLAFDDAIFNETTIYTVTYKHSAGEKPNGTLVEGESVRVKNGTVFNVARTDKS